MSDNESLLRATLKPAVRDRRYSGDRPSSGSLLKPGHHLSMIHQTRLLMDNLAVLHDHKIRDTHYIEPLSQSGPAFRVHLQDDRLSSHLRRSAFHFGRSHPAWTAPRGPEVDQDRNRRP